MDMVVRLAPDALRDLAAEFDHAAERGWSIRAMIDGDGLKISIMHGSWTPGMGRIVEPERATGTLTVHPAQATPR